MKTNKEDKFFKELEKKGALDESLWMLQKQKSVLVKMYGAEYGCDTALIPDTLILETEPCCCGPVCKCTHELIWYRGNSTGRFGRDYEITPLGAELKKNMLNAHERKLWGRLKLFYDAEVNRLRQAEKKIVEALDKYNDDGTVESK